MVNIMVVEDEKPISNLIALSLKKAGYHSECAYDGLEAIDMLEKNYPDLILLDIMLPGADGFEILEYVKPLEIPVIFLTAKGDLNDRVNGLRYGAEDYIVKPFEIMELLARIEVVLRRYHKLDRIINILGLEIDTDAMCVKKEGKEINLTKKEYDTLLLFARNPGNVLFREIIYERVWGWRLHCGKQDGRSSCAESSKESWLGRFFDHCAQDGIPSGGTKMKFRWKLMIITMLIVSFGFGGMLLIQYSYQASIKQEKRAARNSYEMILRMLKEINEMDDTYQNQTFASVLKRLNWQGLLRDSSVRLLKEQHGEVQWKQPLYYNRKNDNFRRSNGFSTKQGKAVVFQNKNKVYYQITSKISYGKETMVFQGAYDISEVYATRHQQLVSFRKIFVLVIGIEIVVSYFLAMILTRPLQKLSQVSKQIADGDYSVRVPVHTEDEIGELSVSFNYMTEQLIEKLMKLDQLLKNQEEFMGSFAHEMKTPLTSIIGYADLMRMEALSKEEQKEACGYIYSEGKRLQNLSLKLMKLLVLKNQQFQMKKQDLEPMIQEAVTSMQYRLKEQDILVNLNLKKAICKIEPDLLKSLILNLIDNALKSMNSGGILTVEDRAIQEGAKIYISDTGCGMPKDEISKITEAFYRIDKSRSRKQGGVGLGLAICKEIVRIHQGEMRFISQQGKGTTVIITIGGGAYEKTN